MSSLLWLLRCQSVVLKHTNNMKRTLLACLVLLNTVSWQNQAFALSMYPSGGSGSGGSSSSSGLTVGDAISGGTTNTVLFKNNAGNLASDANFLSTVNEGGKQLILKSTTSQTTVFGMESDGGSNGAWIDLYTPNASIGSWHYIIRSNDFASGEPFQMGYCAGSGIASCGPSDEQGIISYTVNGSIGSMVIGSLTRPSNRYSARKSIDLYSADNANSTAAFGGWGARGSASNRIFALSAHNSNSSDSASTNLTGALEFYTGDSGATEGRLDIYLHDSATTVNPVMRMDGQARSVSVGTDTVSPTNFWVVENNTDTTPTVEIENTGTGDAGIQFSAGGTGWALGNDNSDGDRFKISHSTGVGTAVLGTEDAVVIDINGLIKFTSKTSAQLEAITPAAAGYFAFCTDCSPVGLYYSTGTGVGAFVSQTDGTTPN